jgi:hypothetical protein
VGLRKGAINETAVEPIHITEKLKNIFLVFPSQEEKIGFFAVFYYPY